MNKLLNHNPLLWAALLSFALSVGLSFQDVINQDGILYLRVAKEFVAGHYAEGLAIYHWAFFPALIAGVSSLTRLSLEHSATLLDASFMALMAAGFVALTRELGGTKTVQWAAALIFLIHPGINGYREYIIRDFGAWAMLICSLVSLCRFSVQPRWALVFAWTLTSTLAVLFRPEAIFWLLLGPFALLVSMPALSLKQRWLALVQCKSLFLFMTLAALIALTVFDLSLPPTRLNEIENLAKHLLSHGIENYANKAQAFSELMSIYFKFDHALVILALALLFYGVFLIIKLISPLYLIFLGYAYFHRPLIQRPQLRLAVWMLIVYALIYLGFLFSNYFISSRYLIPWVTVAIIWVPFALVHLWGRAPGALKSIIALIFVYMFLEGVLSFGYSKLYLKNAGHWIRDNTPATAQLYTEEKHVAYYADRALVGDPDKADVIAIYYSRKYPEAQLLIDSLSQYPQVDFHNKRKDGVRVVVIKDPSS